MEITWCTPDKLEWKDLVGMFHDGVDRSAGELVLD